MEEEGNLMLIVKARVGRLEWILNNRGQKSGQDIVERAMFQPNVFFPSRCLKWLEAENDDDDESLLKKKESME